jgi:type II secretory pathway pseudopilin PulG
MPTRRSSDPRRARGEAGATIIEVLVSLALVVIGLLGVYSAYTSSVRASSHSQRVTQATARAERQLEILRNAPTAAIACLAAGSDVATCAARCCAAMGDGGVTCTPSADGGTTPDICKLVPPPETDPLSTSGEAGAIVYTYQRPTVSRINSIAPCHYDVIVQVDYTITGETIGGTDVRSVVLKSSLYKPE